MADFNLSMPTLRNGASAEEKINILYEYCTKQNNTLKQILNNMDVDSFGEDVALEIKNAAKAAETAGNAANAVEALKADFKKNAELLFSKMESITKTLNGLEVTANSAVSIAEETKTTFEANSKGFAVSTVVVDYINRILGGSGEVAPSSNINYADLADGQPVASYSGLIQGGIMNIDGKDQMCIVIKGVRNNETAMSSVHTANEVKFLHGNDEKAHFGADDMYIDQIRCHTQRFAGKHDTLYFSFVPTIKDGQNVIELRYGDTTMETNLTEDVE